MDESNTDSTSERPYDFGEAGSWMTANKLVAVTPFPTQHVEKKRIGGMALIEKKISLQELTVLLFSENFEYEPGDTVFVRGDQVVQPWAKEVFTIGEIEFILIPQISIVATNIPYAAQRVDE